MPIIETSGAYVPLTPHTSNPSILLLSTEDGGEISQFNFAPGVFASVRSQLEAMGVSRAARPTTKQLADAMAALLSPALATPAAATVAVSTVREIAHRYARNERWCGTAQDCLEEMGISWSVRTEEARTVLVRDVVRVATDYGTRYGVLDVVRRALREVEQPGDAQAAQPEPLEISASIRVHYNFTATIDPEHVEEYRGDPRAFLANRISPPELDAADFDFIELLDGADSVAPEIVTVSRVGRLRR
jgi:hypothetical protein